VARRTVMMHPHIITHCCTACKRTKTRPDLVGPLALSRSC
jgi:hypothetical protein